MQGENCLRVRECTDADSSAWDEFANAHPSSSMFHLFGWRSILEKALGHRTYYMIAEQDGNVAGILPLVHVKSLMFGNTLSSLAFSAHAGPLTIDAESLARLYESASQKARELSVGSLEYRLLAASGRGLPTKHLYESFSKPITSDQEANLAAIRGKQRNIVRKGIKNGLTCTPDSIERFFHVYSESVRNLGTPVFPKRLFDGIRTTFPTKVEFVSAEFDGQAVSSAMNFYFRDTVCPYYWGGTAAARDLKGNDFLAWAIMGLAGERGATTFDFGRSKQGTGAYQWKLNLGFVPQPLFYEYELVSDRAIPEINPLNPKYRLFVEAWKRMPLAMAEFIGPWLSRYLG